MDAWKVMNLQESGKKEVSSQENFRMIFISWQHGQGIGQGHNDYGGLDYQPLFGKGARAPSPLFGEERHERAAEIEPTITVIPRK